MLVLLTNDDGIDAAGINELAKALERYSHEVWIVAPDSNQSGISHGISSLNPPKIEKIGERAFSCSGKPADCVIAAFSGLLPQKPDVVLSGINYGANLGTDVIFSGTVAAARQAAFYGIPAAAVSLVIENKMSDIASFPHWENLADFAAKNVEVFAKVCGQDLFANVNAVSIEAYKGFKVTTLCKRIYHDTMRVCQNAGKDDTSLFSCVFESGYIETISSIGDDWDAVKDGYISISPVLAQPVAAESLKKTFLSAPFLETR